ncbi:MAG: hypothetical protein IIB67_05135 [Proteobacteria bacterium]|nr:hypothetical protein [Pseudomonadota bacterium]
MSEGKNREIRKVMSHLGLAVNRLIRISFGPFRLSDLEAGAVREVPRRILADQLGTDIPSEEAEKKTRTQIRLKSKPKSRPGKKRRANRRR